MSSGIERGALGPEPASPRREHRPRPTTDLDADERRRRDLTRLGLESRDRLGHLAEVAGLRRVDVVAWRDLDDVEAGGSELHAHEIITRWADAGIDVRLWTSRVDGKAREIHRSGYTVNRRAGRYAVFPRTAVAGLRQKIGTGDGLVEIWNGMPFFSPLWSRCPRIVFLHHVHAEMWNMVLSPSLARVGNAIERRVAPPFYRRSQIVTLSGSARDDLVERLRFNPKRVTVIPPGIDPRFSPGPGPDPDPLVVAVGRLVPVKRFDRFVDGHGRPQEDPAPAAGHDRRGGIRAAGPGGTHRPGRCRGVVRAARSAGRCRAPGRLPTGLGGQLHLGPGGLGHDPHRGRGVRHAGRGHPDRRTRGCRGGRRVRTAGLVRPRTGRGRRVDRGQSDAASPPEPGRRCGAPSR